MKVLIIGYDMEVTSGWGRHAAMIAREYDALGIDYDVISELGRTEPRPRESKLLLRSRSPIAIVKNIWRVCRAARGMYDIVHAFDVWPYGLYGYAAVFGTRSRLFLNGIGTYSVAPLYSPVRRLALRLVFARTTKIFCISDYTKREMLHAMPPLKDKLVTVHLGATDLPLPQADEIEKMMRLFDIRSSPIILTVGAIKDRKGQLDTVKAIGLLKKDYPEILYLIVGSSDDSEYVEAIRAYARTNDLESNMRIIDRVGGDDGLAALYEICDVFAMNSKNDSTAHHFEGFGLVFLEAYQFGKPGIGSRDCGIEDAIQDGVTGYLTEQGNPMDIAEKMRRIIVQGPKSFNSVALAMRHRFSWHSCAQSYVLEYVRTQ